MNHRKAKSTCTTYRRDYFIWLYDKAAAIIEALWYEQIPKVKILGSLKLMENLNCLKAKKSH